MAEDIHVLDVQGATPTTTAAFSVGDRWEVRWHGNPVVNITVLGPDGSIVAGAASVSVGSLYIPKGGNYRLMVSGPVQQWGLSVVALGGATDSALLAGSPFYIPPANGAPLPDSLVAMSNATVAPPPAATTAAPPAAPAAPPATMTAAQANAVVVIKGDKAEGTGFMVKTPDGPAIITNIHVISDNPNIHIMTNGGSEVVMTGLKGATDRDLAMILIKDNNYSYLDLATDVSSTGQTGDAVITPGNSEGGEVVLNTPGTISGIGAQRVEITNPIYHGNSGGPIFHSKSGKVIGVVTEAMQVDTSSVLDKASFASRNSAISGSVRYFGLRLDTVPKWEVFDKRRFDNETAYMSQFHDESKYLDSYLNAPDDSKPEDLEYLKEEKIKTANANFKQSLVGADGTQRIDAFRRLMFDLGSLADTNFTNMKDPDNFYTYDQQLARNEVNYRQALKNELDSMSTDVERYSGSARAN